MSIGRSLSDLANAAERMSPQDIQLILAVAEDNADEVGIFDVEYHGAESLILLSGLPPMNAVRLKTYLQAHPLYLQVLIRRLPAERVFEAWDLGLEDYTLKRQRVTLLWKLTQTSQ